MLNGHQTSSVSINWISSVRNAVTNTLETKAHLSNCKANGTTSSATPSATTPKGSISKTLSAMVRPRSLTLRSRHCAVMTALTARGNPASLFLCWRTRLTFLIPAALSGLLGAWWRPPQASPGFGPRNLCLTIVPERGLTMERCLPK